MAQEIYDQMLAAGAPDLRKYDNDYFYRVQEGPWEYHTLTVRQKRPLFWWKSRSVQIGRHITFDIDSGNKMWSNCEYLAKDAPLIEHVVKAARRWADAYEDCLERSSRHEKFQQFLGDHP